MAFNPIYTEKVLNPCYKNWKDLFFSHSVYLHRAHLIMLLKTGIITHETARKLKYAVDSVAQKKNFPKDIPPGSEDLYFVFEKQMEEVIGQDTAGFLHTARSRNDMDTTVFRMFVRTRLMDFLSCCINLLSVIQDKVCRQGDTPIVLYTHGQPANPSTLGHYLSAFALDLCEDINELFSALRIVDRSSMGACAITTTGFNIDRKMVSDLLGFENPVSNSYQAIVTSHWLTYPADAVRKILNDVTRFSADLSHKASCEVGILLFPDELVQISSIMPQKRNPVIIEHIRIQAGMAMGIMNMINELFHNAAYQDINEVADAPVKEFENSLELAESVVALMSQTIKNIDISRQRVSEIALSSGTTTTELADELVRLYGISFRQAHSITAGFVRSGYDKDALRNIFQEKTDRSLKLSDKEIDEILSIERFISVRKVSGGPSEEGMEVVLKELEKYISAFSFSLDKKEKDILSAQQNLKTEYDII